MVERGRGASSLSSDREEVSKGLWLLLTPAALLYLVTFCAPLVVLLLVSFERTTGGVTASSISLQNYADFFSDGVTLRAVGRTLYLSFAIALGCLLLGYPVALSMRRAQGAVRLLLLFLVISPLLTSVIVRNVSWI